MSCVNKSEPPILIEKTEIVDMILHIVKFCPNMLILKFLTILTTNIFFSEST